MLVQKRRTQNKTIFLWGGIAIIVTVAALLVYQNISTEDISAESNNTIKIERITVPTSFGEELFSDPRFNEVSSDKQVTASVDPYILEHDILAQSVGNIVSPFDIQVVNPGFGGRLNILWSAVDNENITGYVLSRSQRGSSLTEIAHLTKDQTSYNDITVVNGEVYSYRVVAISGILAQETTEVSIERNAGLGNSITFAFPDTVEAVQIYRTQNGIESLLATLKDQTTQYIDSIAQDDAEYRAVLYAQYTESENSPIATGIPVDIIAPDAPADIKVVSAEDGAAVHLFWTNPLNPDFDYVRIYRSTLQGSLGSLVKNVRFPYIADSNTCLRQNNQDAESFAFDTAEGNCFIDDINIQEGNTYYYILTSVDQDGNESSRRIIRAYGKDNPFSL